MASIFRFSAKHCDYQGSPTSKEAKALLGGKGAGLVLMAQQGLNVPPGFTIPTDVCNSYLSASDTPTLQKAILDETLQEVTGAMDWLTKQFGYTPLVSVRSGAPVSMPGMMDTILNVGLTMDLTDPVKANLGAWINRLGYRAAMDSQRRLIQMLGATAFDVPMSVFDFQLAKVKKEVGAKSDTDMNGHALAKVVDAYLDAFTQNRGFDFPMASAVEQLRAAIKAVFESWNNERAIEYRKIHNLSDSMGTAVTVQAMVFGNMGDDSGSGVLFTRDPSTGAKAVMGEYLANAQGEDVVAGIRTPVKLGEVPGEILLDGKPVAQKWLGELESVVQKLEALYRDMVDVEFTVQKGKLFILQSREGKRSARAAFKIAVDLVGEGVIDKATAFKRIKIDQFKTVRRPSIDPKFKVPPSLVGLPACPGVVSGRPVFSAKDAVDCNEPCILVTHETNPNDIAGMAKALGVLTQTGGATSHAAVVARAMDKACVVGCTALDIAQMQGGGKALGVPVAKVTIDGSTGNVWFGVDVPVIDASDAPEIRQVMDWCLEAMGAVEATTVALPTLKEHRIFAVKWWGNEAVLDAVLIELVALPSRDHIVLDIRAPKDFEAPVDAVLGNCFGPVEHDDFKSQITSALKKRNVALTGLTVLSGVSGQGDLLGVKPAVPADYAAFTMLAH